MYWSDSVDKPAFVVPDDIVDIGFRLDCRSLPVDHAYDLANALFDALPWLRDEQGAGIHRIHAGATAHGWQQPGGMANDVLHLSKRTRLFLRIPRIRILEAESLNGRTLEVAQAKLGIGPAKVRPLSSLTTLFARYTVVPDGADESELSQFIVDNAAHMGVTITKLLCGLPYTIATPGAPIHTRSVLVADLDPQDSVTLQQHGIGPDRLLGCGLFVPYKSIDAATRASA